MVMLAAGADVVDVAVIEAVAVAVAVVIVIVGMVAVGTVLVVGVVVAGALDVTVGVPVVVPLAVGLPVRPSIASSVAPLSEQANSARAALAAKRDSSKRAGSTSDRVLRVIWREL
jgi:uncharacterized protein (DUF983 family)